MSEHVVAATAGPAKRPHRAICRSRSSTSARQPPERGNPGPDYSEYLTALVTWLADAPTMSTEACNPQPTMSTPEATKPDDVRPADWRHTAARRLRLEPAGEHRR